MATKSRFQGRLAGKKVVLKPKTKYDLVRVESMIKAHEGVIVDDLDKTVNYLVVSDLSGGVTVQKQAASLNAKGASIQVIDGDAMKKMLELSEAELIALLKMGPEGAKKFAQVREGDAHWYSSRATSLTVSAESFAKCELNGVSLFDVAFENCNFVECQLSAANFGSVHGCDFSDATAASDDEYVPGNRYRAPGSRQVIFHLINDTRFCRAHLRQVSFQGAPSNSDFSDANLELARFGEDCYGGRGKYNKGSNVTFARAKMHGAQFSSVNLDNPSFEGADLSAALFSACDFQNANFRGASLEGASFVDCKLRGADFSGTNLKDANLGDSDMTDANVAGADLAGCALRCATTAHVDFSKAKNYDPNATTGGSIGPSLQKLDNVVNKARRIDVSFLVRAPGDSGEGDPVGVNSGSLRYGWGLQVPSNLHSALMTTRHSNNALDFSAALLKLAGMLGNRKVRYETVDVSSTKSPTQGKELRDLMLKAISEAFAQPLPPDEELAQAAKAYREKDREKNAAARQAREKEKAAAEKARKKETKQAEKKIEKALGGKVKDISTFLTALELRIEKPKIDKATSMLKKSGFQLYNDITDTFMSGVVKSQTDPDLVYACRINHDGTYACCTQNLNICGGLRGSVCKHLLVLIIGLVKAGTLDPVVIDGWVAKSLQNKAALDKEVMGEIFIKYKGAEAGEVDWRPTETLPEDYYAV